jgi:T4 bacteriophage base plate protein
MFKINVPEMIVKLPSAGILNYSPAEVRLRAITGKEEMKMNSTNLVKYIDLVIKECARDVATGEPLRLEELSSEDKVYLFIMLRSLSYGDSMVANYKCNVCGTLNEVSLELSKLPVKPLTKTMIEDAVFMLPVSKMTIKLRILSDHEVYELEAEARAMEIKTKKSFKECQDLLLKVRRIESVTFEDDEKGLVTEENTSSNRSIFQLFVESLIGKDLAFIDRKWNELNDYGIDLRVDHKCSSCGTVAPVGVDVTSTEFFRPSETD